MHSFHQCLKCCCDRFTFDEEDFISIDKIKIQNDNNSENIQKKPKYTVEVIYECSIGRSGMNGLSKYTLNDKVFYISTNNLNYFDYLNPNCIQITYMSLNTSTASPITHFSLPPVKSLPTSTYFLKIIFLFWLFI